MKKFIGLFVSILLLSGCASWSSVGHSKSDETANMVNERYELIVIKTRDVFSPSTTTVMVYDKESGELTKVEGGTGPGMLGTVAGPAATAYAGHEIGKGIRKQKPDQTSVNSNNSTVSGSGSKALAGAAALSKSKSSSKSFQMQGQLQGQKQGQWQDQDQNATFIRRNLNPFLD